MLKIKGNEIEEPSITNSFGRRAVQLQNKIISILKQLGVERDYVDLNIENIPQKKAPALVSWYYNGRNLKYTYSLMPRFIENLYVINKVLTLEVEKLLSGEITKDQFSREFSEDDDLSDQLTEARELLEVSPTETDFEVISKSYKKLARKYHPDMSTGDHDRFLKINAAHKLINKELN